LVTENGENSGEIINEKIEVLKETENTKIGQNTTPKQHFSISSYVSAMQSIADAIIYYGAKKDKRKKLPVPHAIKEIAGNNNQPILKS
jgi:hypothetical protein